MTDFDSLLDIVRPHYTEDPYEEEGREDHPVRMKRLDYLRAMENHDRGRTFYKALKSRLPEPADLHVDPAPLVSRGCWWFFIALPDVREGTARMIRLLHIKVSAYAPAATAHLHIQVRDDEQDREEFRAGRTLINPDTGEVDFSEISPALRAVLEAERDEPIRVVINGFGFPWSKDVHLNSSDLPEERDFEYPVDIFDFAPGDSFPDEYRAVREAAEECGIELLPGELVNRPIPGRIVLDEPVPLRALLFCERLRY